jgi:tetratricopeptide (TPR) repeat protein
MKRFVISVSALFFLLSCCTAARATNPIDKLSRGIINIPTSLIEIPKAYSESKEELDDYGRQNPFDFFAPLTNVPYQYLIKAPLTGISRMIGRIGIGCYDIVTFPFSYPRYYAPVYEPEFVYDRMPYSYKLYDQGVVFMDRQQYRKAVGRFTQALNVEPANAEAFYNRGKAYHALGEYRRSVDDLNAAESLGFHPELD